VKRRTRPVRERLLSRIEVDEGSGCWLWKGCPTGDGYGQIRVGGRSDGKTFLAHRLAYETFRGPIPEGLTLDHLCRVRRCVNPAHLEPVTMRENILRGESLAAKNATKSTCKEGHTLDEKNTYLWRGHRHCRACGRKHAREYQRRKRVA